MYKILANTLFMGKKLVFVPECHSTNSLAQELGQKKELPEGTIVVTHHQSRGRGQQGNAWISEAGKNLTFSVVLKPTFLAIQDQFLLNMVASLGISGFVHHQLGRPVRVKWPNDVMLDDRKISGVLIENQIKGPVFTNSIMGIGLNVNQKGFLQGQAVSMNMVSGQDFDLQSVLEGVCLHLEKWYLRLKQKGAASVRQPYVDSLYAYNETRTFSSNGRQFEGIITGVDGHGRLAVKEGEETRLFNTKEIQLVF